MLNLPANNDHPESGCLSDPAFIDTLRQQMLAFATLQISDRHLAEDAVQEALMGAMKNSGSFAGRSALKTWVFAILKHKIVDVLRQSQRVVPMTSLVQEDETRTNLPFNQRGFWLAGKRPGAWSDPEQCVHDIHFWRVFEICLNGLPPKQARIFMMREFIELDSAEICSTLEISLGNLQVILHRARLRLRECLENNWFLDGECSC